MIYARAVYDQRLFHLRIFRMCPLTGEVENLGDKPPMPWETVEINPILITFKNLVEDMGKTVKFMVMYGR